MPFGAEFVETGVRFSLWAPTASAVTLVLDGRDYEMPKGDAGWHSLFVEGAKPGGRYSYRISDDAVPDPASRFQPDDVKGDSAVVDPLAYEWRTTGWRGRPWEEAVIYEVHVGTATQAGTFAALAETLPDLVALGVTVVELMPLNEFHGRRNWGYDGVLPYAPDSSYGTPDDLKLLVDRAHELGLMMMLDVVYNHFGPVGNHLSKYASTFFTDRHQTPWGAGLNVDGADGKPVREFFVENALYWLDEFQFDGLRFDAVHAILDDSGEHLIAELGRRCRALDPDRHIHLVLENEHNQARWLERDSTGRPPLHTAQWNDDIHHCWHVLLTGEAEAYYADFANDPVGRLRRALAEGFVYQGEPTAHGGGKARGTPSGHLPPSAFVAFLQNHDQIGNRAMGDRLSAAPERLSLGRAGLLLSPQIPMLFMGEEWGASTPFQFFVDFSDDPDLSRAVREGRRREFRHFAAFASVETAETIPDPTAEATFRASRLDRSEVGRAPHDGILAETRALLGLRRQAVVPLTKSRYLGSEAAAPHSEAIDVTWRYEAGTLRFCANFGGAPAAVSPRPGERIVWASADLSAQPTTLPAWTGFFTVGDRT